MNYFYNTYNRVQLLDDFAKRVANKEYQKVPYTIWRKMTQTQNPFLGISICADKENANVCVLDKECVDYENIGVFDCEDKSFGTYLYEHLNEMISEGPVMYNNTSNSWKYENDITSTASNLNINSSDNPYWNNTATSNSNVYLSGAYTIKDLQKVIDKTIEAANYKKEKNKMNTSNLFNFDFGPASNSQFRMSPYGLAVCTQNNNWVAYNAKTGDLMDVDILNFDISKMIYKMPVALAAIKPGDILMHSGKPVFVREVATGDNTVRVIDYTNATVADILPVKSPFGFNFFIKIVSLIDFSNMSANADNPFGNMLPFLMLNGEKDSSFDPTLLFMASTMNGGNMDFASNPMILYCLMNRQDKGDILPFLMMMNGDLTGMNSAAAPVNTSVPANA